LLATSRHDRGKVRYRPRVIVRPNVRVLCAVADSFSEFWQGRDYPESGKPWMPLIDQNDGEGLRRWLASGARFKKRDSTSGASPIEDATTEGRTEIVALLAERGAPIWVLRTNTPLPASAVALQYKKLWMVEHWFRACKSLLETRPIYHQRKETIRGHVFCSFLALVLRHELQARLQARGQELEWADVIQDLERVQYVEVEHTGKRFWLRTELQGTAGRVFQAAGVAAPPTVQQIA
jgi:hypothetical protein